MSLENYMGGKEKILDIKSEATRRIKVSPNKRMQSDQTTRCEPPQ